MSKTLKLILAIIGGILAIAIITGGTILISKAIKKNKISTTNAGNKNKYGTYFL